METIKTQNETKLLTVQDVCSILAIKESKLRDLIFRKLIPVVRYPGSRMLRFSPDQIEKWIEEAKTI